MKKRKASSTVFIIAFFVAFLAFTAFAVDGTIIFTQRAKLQSATEAAAMAGASEFNYSNLATSADIEAKVIATATDTLDLLKVDSLEYLKVNVGDILVDTTNKEVKITVNYLAQPYFLAFLGVTGVNLQAVACAKSEPLDVKAFYPSINWITSAGEYFSSIISKDKNFNDTAILSPLGNFMSASIDPDTGWVDFDAIDSADGVPLSLGPGGFITIRLPAPIIDKPGNDLYVREISTNGSAEGYFVFAGLDNNTGETTDQSKTTGPYVNVDKPGAGISWINITCSATSDVDPSITSSSVSTKGLGNQAKIYGSAFFNLNDSCIANNTKNAISMAKYIRIVDDNSESAYVKNTVGVADNKYYKAMFYGEASTDTAGADIDSIQVLNHVRLMPPSQYGT